MTRTHTKKTGRKDERWVTPVLLGLPGLPPPEEGAVESTFNEQSVRLPLLPPHTDSHSGQVIAAAAVTE